MAEQAARDVLRECVDQVAANMVVVARLDDPEGPHQLRVGLRRLRSAFSVFGAVLKSPEMERLKRRGAVARPGGRRAARPRRGRRRDRPARGRAASGRAGAGGPRRCARHGRRPSAREHLVALLAGERAQSLVLDLVAFRRDARLAGAGGFRADGAAGGAGRAARRGGARQGAGRRRASMPATWRRSMPSTATSCARN